MKALHKDTLVEIKVSFTRLLSLIVMIMIGVAVFVGLKVTGPAMIAKADRFLEGLHYQDLTVRSTFGINDKDVKQLDQKSGIEDMEYGYTVDLLIKDKEEVVRLQNMNERISLTQVVAGKIPEKDDEILLDRDLMSDYKIGDKISFQEEKREGEEDPLLDRYQYTISGFGINPEYITEGNKGSTTEGDGSLKGFAVTLKDHFKADKYSVARYRFKDLKDIGTLDSLYSRRIKDHESEFQKLLRDRPQEKYNSMITEINDKITEGQEEIRKGQRELKDAEQALIDGKKEIDEGRRAIENQKAQIQAMGAPIPRELSLQEDALNRAQEELDDNKEKYETEKKEADEEIKQAQEDIQDAREGRNLIIEPVYDINSRIDESSLYSYFVSGKNLDIISNIFPVFFFLIAMLVSLTTMTRMIDEERIQVGTLKALGYSNNQISRKYLIYGAVASIIGTILGILIGTKLISFYIAEAYSVGYIFDKVESPWRWDINFLALLVGLLCTSGVAYLVLRKSLRENAATLLRGKPPKGGTRIFMERIKPLWSRLNFLQKVTMRNIFRYKKRMFMTIIGVAGCTALIFMGFAIRDSVKSTMTKQFEDILKYDFISIYNNKSTDEKIDLYKKEIKDDPRIKESTDIYMEEFQRNSADGIAQSITLIAPKDADAFTDYVKLKKPRKEERISLTDQGIVLSEKAAAIFGVEKGDLFTVRNNKGKEFKLKVADICEYYIGHYIFGTPAYLNTVFDENIKLNGNMAITDNLTEEETEALLLDIMKLDAAAGTVNTDTFQDYTNDLVDSIDVMVYIIIIGASMLAFVVLYNLTNINVSERQRELSTIKVLGFYPKEVTAYVYRETMLLTLIGILVGYLIGYLMHKMILDFLMGDSQMMDPTLHGSNFLLSAGITILFSVIVMLIVHRMLKRIDMVEALKAIE